MEEEPSRSSLAIKYFFHGILFSILLAVLGLGWAFIFAGLVITGFIIGLIIGFVLLFLLMGFLNAFITDLMWNINTKTDWGSLLAHGFVLSLALIVVAIPSFLINVFLPSLVTTVILSIVYCFVDGFIAKKVASGWEEEEYEEIYE